ncbi:unnamed protein product [Lampetra planeri]
MTGVRQRINGEFAHMRAALDEEEKAALARASKKERELLTQIEKNIAHYQREIGELQAAAARLEGLAQERDSLAFLQDRAGYSRFTLSSQPRGHYLA